MKQNLIQLGPKQIDLSKVALTSRSAIETYQNCNYKRYLQHFYEGKGIVAKRKSIALTTGSATHGGIEILTKLWKIVGTEHVLQHYEHSVENAIKIAIENYQKEIESGLQDTPDSSLKFAILEQASLIEALTRIWAHIEFPALLNNYDIYESEREMLLPLVEDKIYLQVRVDAILQDRRSKDYKNYSIKTTKQYNEKTHLANVISLQPLTEIAGVEYTLWLENQKFEDDRNSSRKLLKYLQDASLANKIATIIDKVIPEKPTRVMGTRFCYLVKGRRDKHKEIEGLSYTSNPFIRGYRNGSDLAHSYYYPNPGNVSGQSSLGSKWKSFNVWEEYQGGVKQWFKDIIDGKVQNVVDPQWLVSQQCWTPPDVFFGGEQVSQGIQLARNIEIEVNTKARYPSENVKHTFFQNKRACLWPTECEYNPICNGIEVGSHNPAHPDTSLDPLNNGYEVRNPHHEHEREVND